MNKQIEKLNRGLVAIKAKTGIFVSWRLFVTEVDGFAKTGLTGANFNVYRDGKKIATVTDSTNYLDKEGTDSSKYAVSAVIGNTEGEKCPEVSVCEKGYFEIPMKKPEGGVTPAGQAFEYSVNDMSVGDVDGDGEYEYFVKWDPSNSHDVSHRGYTGHQLIDCYKLDGTLLWRLDMGCNIRAGAHYTQFMVYDFNGDGKAEMAVKSAPGTVMTKYNCDGSVKSVEYITLPAGEAERGITNEDNYVCSAASYREHLVKMFMDWPKHPEVVNGHWPKTVEECLGRETVAKYPLSREDAEELTDYFINDWAPGRSDKNVLTEFEGFIYEGPEYLTMFAGDGTELETIKWKFVREDDGLMWGDYAWRRIEPCNRVDRFLSGVAYLDGKRPYLIMCRGYYTRATLVAYDFFDNKFNEVWSADSGWVTMSNPFNDRAPIAEHGTDPLMGPLAGQGDHSLACADVDGDGCMEIIYGAACVDHDGTLLFSTADKMPDGTIRKLGHGDAMHVGRFDPSYDGMQIFNVFEGGEFVPYGFALRDAKTGKVLFGERAVGDLGRCMVGKVNKDIPGYQFWVKGMYDCKGNKLPDKMLGTNMSIRFAPDLTTQLTDGVEYVGPKHIGLVNDNIHGIMLEPEDTSTNNGTKGNPCLVADLFGDYREELVLRTNDSTAVRIYFNTDISEHKLFTLMHDTMYRCGIAWQNNCYNQPCYPSFYYGSDMSFEEVYKSIEK